MSPASGTRHEQVAGDCSTSSDENVGLDHLNPGVKVHQEWIGRCAGLMGSTGNGCVCFGSALLTLAAVPILRTLALSGRKRGSR